MVEQYASLIKFTDVDGQAGNKPSHYSLYSVSWNTPDAKKAEYMVNAESIEIITHLGKTLLPPGEAGFLHFFPVISGKAPVLTNDGKIIRRSSGLPVHIVLGRVYP